jgi:glycosyltransferase involved in cell wall biosynthesis
MEKNIKNLPKISVITPSYNQAHYINQTIQSVLSQKYPNLEYIVMDGGSTDGTLKILKKYKKKIKIYSQKDNGQSDAINKGLKLATGDIFCFINSDDSFLNDSLWKIGYFFRENRQAFWVSGKCKTVNKKNKEVRKIITIYKNILLKYFRNIYVLLLVNFISQPATFWRKEITDKIGNFDEKLHYSMDYDYWLRIYKKYDLYYFDDYLASYRVHETSKAVSSPENQFIAEYNISKKYNKLKIINLIHLFNIKLSILMYRLFLIKIEDK